MEVTVLRGITWDHPRGHCPLVAVSEDFSRRHPSLRLHWDARPLAAFEADPVEALAERYDLLAVDHPFMGTAATAGVLLPLDAWLDPAFLEDQRRASVGPSYASYIFGGHLWALPVDAAAQVSAFRSDLVAQAGAALPATWPEVLEFGRRHPGRMALALNPTHAFCTWVTLGAAAAGDGFWSEGEGLAPEPAAQALRLLKDLAQVVDPASLDLDPVGVLDRLAAGSDWLYVPAVFGYVTYARRDRVAHPVTFANLPGDGAPKGSVLGGVGLAVSGRTRYPAEALSFVREVAGAACQRGLYAEAGGQPGRLEAWLDPEVNGRANNFFVATLPTLQGAFVRPRYPGFPQVQEEAAAVIHAFLRSPQPDPTETVRILTERDAAARARAARARGPSP